MSQGSKKRFYRLPCGCLVASGAEYVVEMCTCCHNEWAERHTRAQIDRQRVHTEQPQAVAA